MSTSPPVVPVAKKISSFAVANSSQIYGSNTWFFSTDGLPSANGTGNNYRATPEVIVQAGFDAGGPSRNVLIAASNVVVTDAMNGTYIQSANVAVSISIDKNNVRNGFYITIAQVDTYGILTVSANNFTILPPAANVSTAGAGSVFTLLVLGSNLIIET